MKLVMIVMSILLTTSQADAVEGSAAYVLGTGSKAVSNLEEQHRRIGQKSYEQLHKAGLKKGMIVWDIGCGSGTMTEYIASAVGEGGHVYALDVSSEMLEAARKRVAEANLKNVTFILGDIQSIETTDLKKADIIYSRLLLMHLQNPKQALKKMSDLLKSEGVISLQESTMSTLHHSPINAGIEEYSKAMIEYAQSKGTDYNIGRKLPELCRELGFTKIENYTSDTKLNSSMTKSVFLGRLAEVKEKLIESKFVTEEKVNEWEASIQTLPEDDDSFSLTSAEQTHIIARK